MSRGSGSRLTLAVLASLVIALVAAVEVSAKPTSPDARDAATVAASPRVVDLRSPDARDAARGVQPTPAPSTSSSSGSSDWAYLATGGGLALVLIAGGTVIVLRRRHRVERAAVA